MVVAEAVVVMAATRLAGAVQVMEVMLAMVETVVSQLGLVALPAMAVVAAMAVLEEMCTTFLRFT